MGLAASQARLLFITARQSDVSMQMQRISNQNMALARDEDEILDNYYNMLDQVAYKDSSNNVITYDNLMGTVNSATGASPTFVTTTSGAVVLNSSYFNALGIQSGKTSGDESDFGVSRTQFIANLTGLSAETVETASQGSTILSDFYKTYGSDQPTEGTTVSAKDPISYATFKKGISAKTGVQELGTDEKGSKGDQYSSQVQDYIGSLGASIKTNLMGLDLAKTDMSTAEKSLISKVENVTNTVKSSYSSGGRKDEDCTGKAIIQEYRDSKSHTHHYKVDYDYINKQFFEGLQSQFNGAVNGTNQNLALQGVTENTNSKGYTNAEWTAAYNTAKSNSDAAAAASGVSTADSSKINYYGQIYDKAAAGWVYDQNLGSSSTEFNAKLQNGTYLVGGQTASTNYTETTDSAAETKAEQYKETETRKIKRKEDQLEQQLTQLQTEYSSLTTDYESVKSIISSNVSRSFTYCQNG